MKNKQIVHAREEVKIYGENYRPSLNLFRFAKSIITVFLYGSSTPEHSYVYRKRMVK